MHRTRRNTITTSALAAAALLLLGSCSISSKGAAPPESAISVPADSASSATTAAGGGSSSNGTSGSDDEADGKMLRKSGAWAAGQDLCAVLAEGPWKDVAYRSDPVGLVQEGKVPPGLDPGLNEAPDEINEWKEAGDYEDPSTLDDPGAITDAMEAAGFDQGAEARWHNGHEEAVITAVRFRDAAAAKTVLSAEAADYCTRAVSSRALPDGSGMEIVRDSGATRVLAVLDDTVISLWACSCISTRNPDGIGTWHDQFRALIDEPTPDTSTS